MHKYNFFQVASFGVYLQYFSIATVNANFFAN